MLKEYICKEFGIDENVYDFCVDVEEGLKDNFKVADDIFQYNQAKVLRAMQKNRLSESHFNFSTGYGYNDAGRDILEDIYADVFKAESALVRQQIISGTHALTVALFGNLKYGDEMISLIGSPYDTMEGVIGAKRKVKNSLFENGVKYSQVELTNEGKPDIDAIKKAIKPSTKLVLIQRSKGYEYRPSLDIETVENIISAVKSVNKNTICMVDNCYCEFVDIKEPSEVGADLVVGSLIKNPGGGIAPVGGYIVGKSEYVENAAYRLTVPGMGKEVGPSLGITSKFMQGLFWAPSVVNASVKSAVFASAIFEKLGFEAMPTSKEKRADIVEAIKLEKEEAVVAFCEGIQKAAPVDSFVVPEGWAMPGYDCNVIMAAGAFTQGSSIELSADAPLKSPYTVYLQGGLTWPHARTGIIIAVDNMYTKGLINLRGAL